MEINMNCICMYTCITKERTCFQGDASRQAGAAMSPIDPASQSLIADAWRIGMSTSSGRPSRVHDQGVLCGRECTETTLGTVSAYVLTIDILYKPKIQFLPFSIIF